MPSRTRPRHRRPRPATLALAVALLGPLLVGASTWEPTEVAALGLPEAGLNPAGQPKQDVLAADGLTVRSRVFASGRWGPWQPPLAVPPLGVP